MCIVKSALQHFNIIQNLFINGMLINWIKEWRLQFFLVGKKVEERYKH